MGREEYESCLECRRKSIVYSVPQITECLAVLGKSKLFKPGKNPLSVSISEIHSLDFDEVVCSDIVRPKPRCQLLQLLPGG